MATELEIKISELTALVRTDLGEDDMKITFFKSGDELVFVETSDMKGEARSSTYNNQINVSGKTKGTDKGDGKGDEGEDEGGDGEGGENQGIENEPDTEGIKLPKEKEGKEKSNGKGEKSPSSDSESDDEGEGKDSDKGKGKKKKGDKKSEEEEDSDDEGGEDGDDNEGEGDDERQKIKVGTHVRIKTSGKEGIVTVVNPDGTYTVEEAEKVAASTTPLMEAGGDVSQDLVALDAELSVKPIATGKVLGDFPIDDIEVISPKGNKGGGGDKEGEESKGEGKKGDKGKGKKKGKGKGDKEKGEGEQGGQGEGDEGEGGEQSEGEVQEEPQEGEQQGKQGKQQQGKGKQSQGIPAQQQPPLTPEDFNRIGQELLDRVNYIKTTKWLVPTFAYGFFNQRIEDPKETFSIKSELIFWERYARTCFSKKNPISIASANKFSEQIDYGYEPFLRFCKANLEFIDGAYFIEKELTDALIQRIQWGIDNTIKSALEDSWEQIDTIEKKLNEDKIYYKFLSLSAILKPELFRESYLNTHLDNLFKFLPISQIALPNLVLDTFEVYSRGTLYDAMSNDLNVLFIMRSSDKKDFIMYDFRNLITKNPFDKNAITTFNKLILSDVAANANSETYADVIRTLHMNVLFFYKKAYNLLSQRNKEKFIKNTEFLVDLQYDSIKMTMVDFRLEAAIA